MKHLILITLTSMLLVACSQEPFTGVKESYYENGEWHAKSIYKNGKRIDHQWQFQARDRY